MKLYTYFRSSAAYRVRIVLGLKGIGYDAAPVHLVRNGGEHRQGAYASVNRQRLLPALQLDDGPVLTQSLAIMEYLEETHGEPALLPGDAVARARVRALCQAVACDIHPLDNLRVLNYLKDPLGHDERAVAQWYRHWIVEGFDALEQMIGDDGYCHGGQVSLADCCLIPQVFNARRFDVDVDAWPRIARIDANLADHPAFAAAHPANQPDSE